MNQLTLDLQPSEPEYSKIPLTQGQFALIDAADYEWLSQWKWHAGWNPPTQTFYAKRSDFIGGKLCTIRMHREIVGAPKGMDVDHKNHDTLDNRRRNLRLATNSQNQQNKRMQKNNTSGQRGVFWIASENRWLAQIGINGKRKKLGRFKDFEEATAAYKAAAEHLFGEFYVGNSAS